MAEKPVVSLVLISLVLYTAAIPLNNYVLLGFERLNNKEYFNLYDCIWYQSKCVADCPDGLIKFEGNCEKGYWLTQRTCTNYDAQVVSYICGHARCDCPYPSVLDTDTGFCYDIDNCPVKNGLEDFQLYDRLKGSLWFDQ